MSKTYVVTFDSDVTGALCFTEFIACATRISARVFTLGISNFYTTAA